MVALRKFVASDAGSEALSRLQAANTAAFPAYVDELRGIAEGSGAELKDIWMLNLLYELEALMPPANAAPLRAGRAGRQADHCTDIYATAAGGSVSLGHNEDWSEAVSRPYV